MCDLTAAALLRLLLLGLLLLGITLLLLLAGSILAAGKPDTAAPPAAGYGLGKPNKQQKQTPKADSWATDMCACISDCRCGVLAPTTRHLVFGSP